MPRFGAGETALRWFVLVVALLLDPAAVLLLLAVSSARALKHFPPVLSPAPGPHWGGRDMETDSSSTAPADATALSEVPEASDVDPILAAIEAHRKVNLDFAVALKGKEGEHGPRRCRRSRERRLRNLLANHADDGCRYGGLFPVPEGIAMAGRS
jgi:hypothetical protein